MSFIDSYKRLEKLCNEIYDDNHGISSYIDEMINNPIGSRYVRSWDEDLKQLKHYRWARNQIVHEPDCSEDNMCEYGDLEWLNDFHSRIMSGNDPLALYHKAQNSRAVQKSNKTQTNEYTYAQYDQHPAPRATGCLTSIIGVLLVVAVVALIVATI